MKAWQVGLLALAGLAVGTALADAAQVRAEMHQATATGPGAPLGTVTISDGPAGAVVTADLKGLPPGTHGFHIHQNGSCGPTTANGRVVPAGAAGGHFDPGKTGRHEGPQGHGHLGDLPVLQVAANGAARETLTAPRIKDVAALRGRSVMIHAGGDSYSDRPKPLGGGGARLACGVLK